MSTAAVVAVVAVCGVLMLLTGVTVWWMRGRWQVKLDRDRSAAGVREAEGRVDRAELEEAERQSGLTDAELAEDFDRRFGGGS